MGTQKRAVAIMDYRYDEGCRVRKEPICPTIARLSDRGGTAGKPLVVEIWTKEEKSESDKPQN